MFSSSELDTLNAFDWLDSKRIVVHIHSLFIKLIILRFVLSTIMWLLLNIIFEFVLYLIVDNITKLFLINNTYV